MSGYHKDTKIMTCSGLKYIKDVNVGQYVWSINLETKNIQRKKVLEIIETHYCGNLVVFNNNFSRVRVSKDHNMISSKTCNNIKIKAKNLIKSGFYHTITNTPNKYGICSFNRGFKEEEIYEDPYDDIVYYATVKDNQPILIGETKYFIWSY